ncbi:MAG: hypothetical protein A2X80_02415 [Geobacteraceae bacterium GWB2_52_12]|nr:MAG: hypothetical protein A2X80_02415 [Geobacteraceae bacterium GWB2_52_12]
MKISPAVAAFVTPGVPHDVRMGGVIAAAQMAIHDRVALLFCLTRDSDPIVKEAAKETFSALPIESLVEYAASSDSHSAILDFIARLFFETQQIVNALLGNQQLSSSARLFLEHRELERVQVLEDAHPDPSPFDETGDADIDTGVCEEIADLDDMPHEDELEEEVIDQQTEEFLSKYQMAQVMGIGEKIKMALTGDKEWRAILIKDANKLVSGGVVKNPRITDGEVLTMLKVGVQNDEIIRLICANKEWIKVYKIRKALVECPKTPLPNALRYLASLNEKDIAGYAKSKNISSVLSTQAKRMLLAKKR